MSKFARFVCGNFLLYLRKSRADDPNETVEEVLSKHEARLQEFMERKYGFRIPEENIYREVCSAESISEREKIKEGEYLFSFDPSENSHIEGEYLFSFDPSQ